MLKRPITPEEVASNKASQIPEVVFEVFNALILETIGSGRVATIYEHDVVQRLKEVGVDSREVYKKGWLDVEGAYRDVGWKVTYEGPTYAQKFPSPRLTFAMTASQ